MWNNKNKGFTLLEAMAAVFIISVGTVGAFSLVRQSIISTKIVSSKLTASYLAQEGIETIRAKRDSNLLAMRQGVAGVVWDSNISGGVENLNFGISFTRAISINSPGLDIIKVKSRVSWQEGSRQHEVVAEELLYKWQ